MDWRALATRVRTSAIVGRLVAALARRPQTWLWLGTAAFGTWLVGLASYRFIMRHYAAGPYIWDSAWFSNAIFQKGFDLPNLAFFEGEYGASLYTQHLYLMMGLCSPVSHLFRTHYHYFATVLGVTYALTFLGPFLAVRALFERQPAEPTPPREWPWVLTATAAGVAIASSGQVLAAIGYPHFEVAIPGFAMLFFALHLLGHHRLKWVALLAGLTVREDAGLHYFGFAFVLWAWELWSKRRVLGPRTLGPMVATSLTASVAMLFAQRHFYPLGASMFHKSYVGEPPFAHLAWNEMGSRLSAFAEEARHIWAPAVVTLAGAVLFRSPAWLLAYLACLPWVAVNVIFSLTPAARTLSLYYAFPLLVGLVWPLFAVHWTEAGATRRRATVAAVATVILAAVVSTGFFSHRKWIWSDMKGGATLPAQQYERTAECLRRDFAGAQKLYADITVVAMFPETIPVGRSPRDLSARVPADGDGLVYFANHDAAAYDAVAEERGFTSRVRIPGFRIQVASREPLGFLACLDELAAEAP